MTTKPYITRTGLKQFKPVLTEQQYLNAEEGSMGFCLVCKAFGQSAEPDAEKYLCQSCGQAKVYGIPQLLIMGLLEIK